jgi:hypothetical protein
MTDKYSMPALELPSSGKHGTGDSTRTGYKIEVRSSYSNPTIIEGFVIDTAWRVLPIVNGNNPWGMNIPIIQWDVQMLAEHGLVSRVVAEAHRWAFLAMLDAQHVTGALCIETRLVKVEVKIHYSTEEKGVSDIVCAPFGRDVPFHQRPPFVNDAQFSTEAISKATTVAP